ncbi:MAG: hypothetical protein K0U65_00700, partial [Gammaproteobacteria bacterium]|nr:hypothetical protein [Gammaproteobacteria bacterium]
MVPVQEIRAWTPAVQAAVVRSTGQLSALNLRGMWERGELAVFQGPAGAVVAVEYCQDDTGLLARFQA